MPVCNARNHRKPVSPAFSASNQWRISSASFSAAADVSTRKVMLAAEVGEKFAGGSGAPSLYILVAFADAFGSVGEVLALPLQIGGKYVIKGRRGVLSAPLGVLFELRLTLRLDWNHV